MTAEFVAFGLILIAAGAIGSHIAETVDQHDIAVASACFGFTSVAIGILVI